jgi:hypothetical protein
MLGVLPHRRGRRRFPSPFTRDGGKRSARRAHMSDLWHLTILTGHMRMSPRSEVADHVVSGSSPREAAPSEIPAGRATNRRSHRRAIARRADQGGGRAVSITPASEQRLWGAASAYPTLPGVQLTKPGVPPSLAVGLFSLYDYTHRKPKARPGIRKSNTKTEAIETTETTIDPATLSATTQQKLTGLRSVRAGSGREGYNWCQPLSWSFHDGGQRRRRAINTCRLAL